MHYEGGSARGNARTDAVVRAVVAAERPDVAVLTGDTLTGDQFSSKAQEERVWRRVLATVAANGTRWALAFGNHDGEGPLSRGELLRIAGECEGGLVHEGPEGFSGPNYALPVFRGNRNASGGGGGEGEGEGPLAVLWVLTVRQERECEGARGWGCVTREQVRWFVAQSQALRSKHRAPAPLFSLLFLHIPLPEYASLCRSAPCTGNFREHVTPFARNTGLYEAALAQGVRGVFVGHNHHNDWCGAAESAPGLALCYGRKTGYSRARPAMARGARVVELAADASGAVSWSTWVREEDGAVASLGPCHAYRRDTFVLASCAVVAALCAASLATLAVSFRRRRRRVAAPPLA
eukprot:m51a1_g4513 putative C-tail anchored protein (350) ;mRNA; r:404170-405489